jgi:hypothetical protein
MMKKTFNTFLIVLVQTAFCACSKNTGELTASISSSSFGSNTALLTQIPQTARNYINGVNNNNLDSVTNSFAFDGVLLDVTRRIKSRAAIRKWANNEVMGGSLRTIEIHQETSSKVRLVVYWAPRGSNGWKGWYTFEYANGFITPTDLQYA